MGWEGVLVTPEMCGVHISVHVYKHVFTFYVNGTSQYLPPPQAYCRRALEGSTKVRPTLTLISFLCSHYPWHLFLGTFPRRLVLNNQLCYNHLVEVDSALSHYGDVDRALNYPSSEELPGLSQIACPAFSPSCNQTAQHEHSEPKLINSSISFQRSFFFFLGLTS